MKIVINLNHVEKNFDSLEEKPITPKIRTSSNPIIIPAYSALYVRYIKNFEYNLLDIRNFTMNQYRPNITSKSFSVFSHYSILFIIDKKIQSILLESTEVDWFYEYYMDPK